MLSVTKRGFAQRVPMIKFLGKRSLLSKDHHHGAASAAPTSGGVKALSFNASVEQADYPAARWQRLPFSQAEIECIELGTNEIDPKEWQSVRL